MRALTLGLLALPALASAQTGENDRRVETLAWSEGAELPLRMTEGGQVTLLFPPGEAVQSVQVGDLDAIAVHVAPLADSLVLRTLRPPLNPAVEIRTRERLYRLRLRLGPASDVAYVVRFSDAASAWEAPDTPAAPATITDYTIKGDVALRPVKVVDDGLRTTIEWGADQPLPAVFALNTDGEEETVDSYIRQDAMVIDRVYPRLIFRIGKLRAEARRAGTRK